MHFQQKKLLHNAYIYVFSGPPPGPGPNSGGGNERGRKEDKEAWRNNSGMFKSINLKNSNCF